MSDVDAFLRLERDLTAAQAQIAALKTALREPGPVGASLEDQIKWLRASAVQFGNGRYTLAEAHCRAIANKLENLSNALSSTPDTGKVVVDKQLLHEAATWLELDIDRDGRRCAARIRALLQPSSGGTT